jgi:hypothetical protein
MRRTGLLLIFAASLCLGESPCPDPGLREAAIGGDTLRVGVVLHKEALAFVWVQLYSPWGAWLGTTDKDGVFVIDKLLPGQYRLEVQGWGSTIIQMNPNLDQAFFQTPAWNILLLDAGCVAVGTSS